MILLCVMDYTYTYTLVRSSSFFPFWRDAMEYVLGVFSRFLSFSFKILVLLRVRRGYNRYSFLFARFI